VKRQLRIDLADEGLKAVDELSMPRQKLGPAVDVGRLVNLILFEPPADVTRRRVAGRARIVPLVEGLDGIA
jgi:hypothetical protein